ncbi:DUF3040 domain-containing protein [Actinoplanes sp. N902-109]|uniref:DUF3040 domain-containing protein n=1 Tax=Actinoplanes sp. (strain N902-109) TaxID=649831 RepID=UPI00032946CB|nr:DUF3040 domain-containing protein [Actinoplanes sp. N902-109]AGL18944.1 hypothetical protein L083_5434 [Actinoplanes sp. N902-109]
MLSSYDRRRFNEIVSGLLTEDPGFASERPAAPRELPRRPVLAGFLWLSMPFLIALGGWTGLLIAVIAGAYGIRLWTRGPVAPSRIRQAHHDDL